METFTREINYLSPTVGENNEIVLEPVTKVAVFKELSRTDPKQHKLHWKIMQAVQSSIEGEEDESGNKSITLDTDAIYDLTKKAVKTLFVPNPEVSDKENDLFINEFLCDSGALFEFGFWLLTNKFAPFFSTFNPVSKR